jgi:hypothetical protein
MEGDMSKYYPPTADRQDAIRQTIGVPSTSNYNYSQREDLIDSKREGDYSNKSGNQPISSQSKVRSSHFDLPTKTIDLEHRSPNKKAFDNTPSSRRQEENTHSSRRQEENTQIVMLKEELRYMRAQQDKILENQNIFQTYISTEITSIKNKMNQMESDIMLAKTMSGGSMMRNDMSQF